MITTYERPLIVRRAITSVLDQTYQPAQIIVVEDGTDSGIDQWLKTENLSHRIQFEQHESNYGLAEARNTGVKLAKGEYIAFLDDDDEWKPEFLTILASVIREADSQAAVAYCGVDVRDRQTDRTVSTLYPRNRGDLKAAIMALGAATLPSSYLFRKSALVDVGGFDENLRSSIDHDIWMSLALNGYHAVAVDEPLVVSYSSNEDRLTTNMITRPRGVRMYVDKWTPVYKQWFGEREGEQYARSYFADVVGRLAADKLVYGKFSDAWRGIRQVVGYSGLSVSLPKFARYVALSAGRRVLPRFVIRVVKGA